MNCQYPGRTGGAEEDKIKEQDLESSMLRGSFVPPSSFFRLFEAGAASESLCLSTEPKIYLTWLFRTSVLPSHSTHGRPTLSTPPLLLFHYCTPSGSHRVCEVARNGFPSAKLKDLPLKTCFFPCNCNVTFWILMPCEVKSFEPVQHNKWPLRAPNGLTSNVFV